MMNLLMREDKTIRLTNIVPVFQYDSLINPLRILVPRYYEEVDLSEFNVVLTYMLPDATVGSVTLVMSEEPYNDDYIIYPFMITTLLTSIDGNVFLKLTFAKVDEQERTYMLTTQLAKLPICNDNDMSGNIDPSDLARIEAQIEDINYRLNVEAAKVLNIDENGLKIVL